MRFFALRRVGTVQNVIDGNDYIPVHQIEQLCQRIGKVEPVPVRFRKPKILYLHPSVQILYPFDVHIDQFVLIIQTQHKVVRRQVAARHVNFVYRVVVFVHVRPQQHVELQSQHRNEHISRIFVIAVGVFGITDFVERDVRRSSDRIPRLHMQVVRY